MEDNNIYLLQYALGIESEVEINNQDEWDNFYCFCQRQSILGVGFQALEKWNGEIKPSQHLIYRWLSVVSEIESRNIAMNEECLTIQSIFGQKGFTTCILKGQGNALLYNKPLRRQSGDIDIWVGGKIRPVILFLEERYKDVHIGYHHTEAKEQRNVDIEVHYRPTWFNSPIRNSRLQKWFATEGKKQLKMENEYIIVPDLAFNTVYQLAHIFNHFIQEGVGMRQIIDYYYVLQNRESKDVMPLLDKFGLSRFAGAMMYVMQTIFLLPEKKLLCAPDVYEGDFLLKEILVSGNFGRYDARNKVLHQKSGVIRKFYQMKRSLRYLRSYPEEVLCSPFRIYHVIWRTMKLWRWE